MKLTIETKRTSLGSFMFRVLTPTNGEQLEAGGWYQTEMLAFEAGLKAARSRASRDIKRSSFRSYAA